MEYRGDFSLKDLTDFLPKTITQIYGPAASGKTTLCLVTAVETVKKGKKVVYIDTEGSFSIERIKQIAGSDFDNVLKNIIVAEPTDFDEQRIAINKLNDVVDETFGLVIVDSLVSLYRLEMSDGPEAYRINRELGKQLATLIKISKKQDIPVVITNQVYADFSANIEDREKTLRPVGRDLLKYWSKNVFQLGVNSDDERVAIIIRHKFKKENQRIMFRLTNGGIK